MQEIVRNSGPDDIESLSELYINYLSEYGIVQVKEKFKDFLRVIINDKKILILVLADEKEIIGFLAYSLAYSPISVCYALYLHDLYIKPSCRLKGYASCLLSEAEIIAKKQNCNKLFLNTDLTHIDSTSLYIKKGYRFTNHSPMSKLI